MSDPLNNKPKPIAVERIDLEKMKEMTVEQPGILPYAHHVGSALVKPEDQGKIKSRALTAMREQTDKQMAMLYKQMEVLVSQAEAIKDRVRISEMIFQAEMRFEPLVGKVYFLYQKENQKWLLSLIGPQEWGRKAPNYEYIAQVQMQGDYTWEVLEKSKDVDFSS